MMKFEKKVGKIDTNRVRAELDADAAALIAAQEERFAAEIRDVCELCVKRGDEVILLCGPSASGKTTTSKLLQKEFSRRGVHADRLSLDNFYKPRSELPFWEDGERNLESIEGIDVPLFKKLVAELFEKGRCELPVFDFVASRPTKTIALTHQKGGILIIEGIHALHPDIYDGVRGMGCCRVYISAHSDILLDGRVVIPARRLRLIRRMIRDFKHRASPANMTLDLWKYIQKGEELYIYPYRHLSDVHINTAHSYEPFLYGRPLVKLLSESEISPKHAEIAAALMDAGALFEPLDFGLIPKTSLIQEFIS